MGMKETVALLKFDLREAFDRVSWISVSWLYFFFQFFIYGSLISLLVTGVENYFIYYGTGLIIISSFNIASWAGRRFVENAHEGRLRYLLSLPMTRSELFLEQIANGVIVNLVRMFPPLVVVLWAGGFLTPEDLIGTLAVLLLITVSIMGLMISLSVIAFKSFDIYSAIVAALSALLIRFSTIIYPLSALNGFFRQLALLNPLTYGSELFRFSLGMKATVFVQNETSLAVLASLKHFSGWSGQTFLISSGRSG